MDRIVVGLDESEGSHRALEWAIEEAGLRDATLRAVHAVPSSQTYFPYSAVGFEDAQRRAEEAQQEAQQALDKLLAEATAGKDVTVERATPVGLPADELVRESRDAELLVVGSRGRGGFRGLLLGSVSQQVVQHAHCPVVVIPAEAR